jgi:hypothetical protein
MQVSIFFSLFSFENQGVATNPLLEHGCSFTIDLFLSPSEFIFAGGES